MQKQLNEIKNVMTNLRRNETCRTKKERILMDAYQLLNADENKSCVPENRARPIERLVSWSETASTILNIFFLQYTQATTRSAEQMPRQCNDTKSPEFRQCGA